MLVIRPKLTIRANKVEVELSKQRFLEIEMMKKIAKMLEGTDSKIEVDFSYENHMKGDCKEIIDFLDAPTFSHNEIVTTKVQFSIYIHFGSERYIDIESPERRFTAYRGREVIAFVCKETIKSAAAFLRFKIDNLNKMGISYPLPDDFSLREDGDFQEDIERIEQEMERMKDVSSWVERMQATLGVLLDTELCIDKEVDTLRKIRKWMKLADAAKDKLEMEPYFEVEYVSPEGIDSSSSDEVVPFKIPRNRPLNQPKPEDEDEDSSCSCGLQLGRSPLKLMH